MAGWGNPSFDLFQLPEEHQELRAAIRALAEKEIAPHARHVDETGEFPAETFRKMVLFLLVVIGVRLILSNI